MTRPTPKHRSFWLEEAMKDFVAQPPLEGEAQCDIAILGGGYVGLWTALHIKEWNPGCEVSILEMDICGGGASGRNGGFVLSWWPKISSLVKLFGKEEGLKVAKDSEAVISEIDQFCKAHSIDAHFRKSPWLWTATAPVHRDSWASVLEVCDQLQIKAFEKLPDAEVARRTGSKAHLQGIVDQSSATLQPASLAMGLRKVALERGVRIYENTKVTNFTRGNPVVISTPNGRLKAQKLIVANNAWAAGIKEFRRSIVPITSDMIVSAPAPQELAQCGWTGGECITDSQIMVDYYHVTKDHRVAFGKGGWGIAYGGNLGQNFDRNPRRAQMVEKDFRTYYPTLKSVPITHDWCGPIDRTPDSLPLLGRLPKHPHIIYGVGWSGNGVGPSVLGGKILASLALDKSNEWSESPLLRNKIPGGFPPEPIRYIGAHIVRSAVVHKETAEMKNQNPSWLAQKLSNLAPAGLEDKE